MQELSQLLPIAVKTTLASTGTDEPSLSQDCMALRSYIADDEDAGEEELYEVEVESGGGKRLRKH
jgi:hypothetical protein